MRVVPDTAILVRMNAKASGPARRLLERIAFGPHELILDQDFYEPGVIEFCRKHGISVMSDVELLTLL